MLKKDYYYRTGLYKDAIFKIKAMREDCVIVCVYESVEIADAGNMKPIDRLQFTGANYLNTPQEAYNAMKLADPLFVDI